MLVTLVDLRINEILSTGAVGNRTYRVGLNAVRLETAPTSPDKSGSKPRGESVYLFLEFTIDVLATTLREISSFPLRKRQKQDLRKFGTRG